MKQGNTKSIVHGLFYRELRLLHYQQDSFAYRYNVGPVDLGT